MLDFFINRFYFNKHFSFLSKSSSVGDKIYIHIISENSLKIQQHIFQSTEPEIIDIDLTKDFTNQQYYYEVYYQSNIIYQSKFLTINPLSNHNIKFGFVSCNDNSKIQSNDENLT